MDSRTPSCAGVFSSPVALSETQNDNTADSEARDPPPMQQGQERSSQRASQVTGLTADDCGEPAREQSTDVSIQSWLSTVLPVEPSSDEARPACDSDGLSSESSEDDRPDRPIRPLDPDHPYAQVIGELETFALRSFLSHMSEFVPGEGPDSTPSGAGPKGTELIYVIKNELHVPGPFSCPYYVRDPQNHQSCLSRAKLDNIQRVIWHLHNVHALPHFCPACGELFDTKAQSEDHILEQSCTRRTFPKVEGVSIYRVGHFLDRADRVKSQESLWFEIWEAMFPGVERPARVSTGVGVFIHILRDYWAYNGKYVVAQFLTKRGLQDRATCAEKRSLRAAVLESMVDDALQKLQTDQSAAWARMHSLLV
ncbi:hypothetical protein NKR23_g10897 [Pleurostoma richardsiae]|uniref:C2H2-type domain-containing protein n=1 Tax=Pleurostoma richardsiae TaxID=41990 RepID=A0AA38VBN9_9PEZI|nr:hypothetical protein NKR23_g10897 [Pleurostoma richardsiae]